MGFKRQGVRDASAPIFRSTIFLRRVLVGFKFQE